MVPLNLVVRLSPSLSKLPLPEFERKISRLTEPQRVAAAAFLEDLACARGGSFPMRQPQKALQEFWSRYARGFRPSRPLRRR
jgi:hypothetical protein